MGTRQQLNEQSEPPVPQGMPHMGTDITLSSHLSSALSRALPRAPSWAVPAQSSFQSPGRTPRAPDTTSSNAPGGAWGAAPGWAVSPRPAQGTARTAHLASPESILGKAELGRKAGQERTFMGFCRAALRGRKLAGKATLAELLLFVGGPHGTSRDWFQPISQASSP